MFRFFKYFIDHIHKIRDREVEEMHETREKKIDHIHKKKKSWVRVDTYIVSSINY